nr:zinc finger, CCHC-type [Tanacetum cinerariifolium]
IRLSSTTFNDAVYCEVISKSKAGLTKDMDAQSNVYVLSNGLQRKHRRYQRLLLGVYTRLLDEANGSILGIEIFRIQSRNTLGVSQSTVYNGGDKVDGGRAI